MSKLKVSEAFCYICRGVLIEPVTIPCLHVFCYTCFEQSMQETSYSCPLCRRRISNWVRTAKKSDKLINSELWTKIREQFGDEVNSKLRGEDDGLDERLKKECPAPVKLSDAGEVAREFSKFMNDFNVERERIQAAEELASKELIIKLTEEEEQEMQTVHWGIKQKLKEDEEFARKLQDEINKEVHTSRDKLSLSQKGKSRKAKGPMDNFIKGHNAMKKRNGMQLFVQENLINRCTSSDSTDSIQPEMQHFKPIKVVPRTPPKRYPDGKVVEIEVTKVKPLKLLSSQKEINSYTARKDVAPSKKIHSPYSAFIGKVKSGGSEGIDSSPRKRLRSSADESDSGVLKEITLGENSDSNSLGTADSDLKYAQADGIKKKRASPLPVAKPGNLHRKSGQGGFPLPPKLFRFDSAEGNAAEEDENADVPPPAQFDTQDYLGADPGIRDELIEEQRRIEELILQEKADRELALKLSQEWEGRYELRRKPNQKPTTLRRKTRGHENKKIQPTLISSLIKKKNRDK